MLTGGLHVKHSSVVRALVAVLCCVGFAQTALADRLDELKSRGKLLVGVSDTTPPFAFKAADGTLTGYDLDLVRADGNPNDYLFLPDFTKSRNVGFAMAKNEARFKAAVNQALLELEASGEATKIWATWFGPGTAQPVKRSFRITAEY